MSETVIREVANGVWTFSRPFARFGIFPVGGRSTAVKLRNGGVWVLASTKLDEETKATLDRLGQVEYIIGADAVHHLFLREFKTAYPGAKLVAPLEAVEKPSNEGLKFDGVWGRDAPDTKYGFEEDIEHCYFSGFKNRDVAFLHKDSKSLIQADLLMNLPPYEQYSKSASSPTVLGMNLGLRPGSWGYSHMIRSLTTDHAKMKEHAQTVYRWDFERIIPCHGDVIEKDGKVAWKTVYSSFLE
ncbi:hypothetical protein CC1G_11341 [Coprinopsis cinerea okayama7|uniref:Uncharacterized protein n=1 Tax=Coprinopsis cinerea (strain Okayama-7 / 130 / ATCC MYA-4618 / FGSC 9003) TaxID=240176 RepID=A8P5T4_COPC7|nr:hypothetical protein CC1G_11341 [Coprinopsis cinerea okayama7\|eukprot:XP_001839018.2 hypothetical protein CC1G_11341 [Coprinopsis cinerea okayama7\